MPPLGAFGPAAGSSAPCPSACAARWGLAAALRTCLGSLKEPQVLLRFVAHGGGAAAAAARPSRACARRARRQVLGLYAGRQWAFIEEHLHGVLGARRREAGDPAGALRHYAAMLASPRAPRAWQATYMRQFLDAVAAAVAARVRCSRKAGCTSRCDSMQPCHAYSRRPQRKRGELPVLDPAPGIHAACLAVKYGILVCYLCITAALSLDAQLTGPAAASTKPFHLPRHAQGEPPELDLPLPEVDAARVAVTCNDQVCYADAAARALPDEAWRRLEAPLLPGAPQAGACQQNRCAKLSVLGRLGAGRAPLLDGGCVQPDWRSAS